MTRSQRALLLAALRLALVVLLLAAGWAWWQHLREPDLRVDQRLRLRPGGTPMFLTAVPLDGGVRDAWRVPVDRPLRFSFTSPGPDAVLRFHESYLEGHPDVAVALQDAQGEPVIVWQQPASEARWVERRVPLPIRAGEPVVVEILARDGRGRPGLGAIHVADVVLESEGRAVDEAAVPVHTRVLLRDLLGDHTTRRHPAPATAESAVYGLAGPECVLLSRDEDLPLRFESVPAAGALRIVIHAARELDTASSAGGRVRVTDERLGQLADIPLDFAVETGGSVREVGLDIDLSDLAGGDLRARVSLEGGGNLFVGLREAFVTGPRSVSRRLFEPESGINVLLVAVDSLRPDRLGAYGYEYGQTPAIDALAERGVRYTRVISSSSDTRPAMASLLTGLSPLTHGLGGDARRTLSFRTATLAQSAAWAGFSTAYFGSSPELRGGFGLDRGFERFTTRGLPAGTLVDETLDWLENHRGFEWFCTVHLGDPSFPHEIVTEEGYVPIAAVDPEFIERLRAIDSRPGAAEAVAAELGMLYDVEVARVDRAVGRLVAWLRVNRLLENTLIMVVGTHGEEFFEHGGRLHGRTLNEEVVRVPLVVAGPGVPRRQVVDTPSELLDATWLLGRLGRIVAHSMMQGRLPEPFGALPGREPVAFSVLLPNGVADAPWETVGRHDRWLYRVDHRADRVSLFDLVDDPGMTVDLAVPGASGLVQGERGLELDSMKRVVADWYRSAIVAAPAWAVPLVQRP